MVNHWKSRTLKIKSWLNLICLKLIKKWKKISLTTRMIFVIDKGTLLWMCTLCSAPFAY
jgi:hypothetical protein